MPKRLVPLELDIWLECDGFGSWKTDGLPQALTEKHIQSHSWNVSLT